MTLGYALQILGLASTLVSVYSYGTRLTLYDLTFPLITAGLGFGFVLAPLLGVVLTGVEPRDTGAASGVVSTSMQIGNTIGISFYGLLFYSFLGNPGQGSSLQYLSAFKLTLPFLMVASITSFLLVFLLRRPRRPQQIVHPLDS